ncbi:WRKY DNA-binding protein 67 [Rhynchospora pubera]|uniref:WRKY DNA-binding protein 67 n=1 Tax=Rhynchospora pubera TaxID=906938 RepID=A0AAV8FV73_9POAL|nr:WRKY DNA-binding protein 67 [Rhynchospora pubera]
MHSSKERKNTTTMESVNHGQSTQEELGEVMNNLQRGLNSASSLEVLIQNRSGSNAQILIEDIKSCFSRAMTTLNSSNLANDFLNQLQLPYANSQNISIHSNPVRSRPRVEANSQEKIFLDNPDDCYAWSLYGQKEIRNSKYPRFYYVCAHKEDLDCHATKTVLPLEGDSAIYEIIYSGQHTCMQFANEDGFLNSQPRISSNSKDSYASSSDA